MNSTTQLRIWWATAFLMLPAAVILHLFGNTELPQLPPKNFDRLVANGLDLQAAARGVVSFKIPKTPAPNRNASKRTGPTPAQMAENFHTEHNGKNLPTTDTITALGDVLSGLEPSEAMEVITNVRGLRMSKKAECIELLGVMRWVGPLEVLRAVGRDPAWLKTMSKGAREIITEFWTQALVMAPIETIAWKHSPEGGEVFSTVFSKEEEALMEAMATQAPCTLGPHFEEMERQDAMDAWLANCQPELWLSCLDTILTTHVARQQGLSERLLSDYQDSLENALAQGSFQAGSNWLEKALGSRNFKKLDLESMPKSILSKLRYQPQSPDALKWKSWLDARAKDFKR